jgi:hypothetical protein
VLRHAVEQIAGGDHAAGTPTAAEAGGAGS